MEKYLDVRKINEIILQQDQMIYIIVHIRIFSSKADAAAGV